MNLARSLPTVRGECASARVRRARCRPARPIFKKSIWKNVRSLWNISTFKGHFGVNISNGSAEDCPVQDQHQHDSYRGIRASPPQPVSSCHPPPFTNGVSIINRVTAIFVFFDGGTFWVLPLTFFYIPKSARAYLFPKSVKSITCAAAPLVLTPFVRSRAEEATPAGVGGARRCLA